MPTPPCITLNKKQMIEKYQEKELQKPGVRQNQVKLSNKVIFLFNPIYAEFNACKIKGDFKQSKVQKESDQMNTMHVRIYWR